MIKKNILFKLLVLLLCFTGTEFVARSLFSVNCPSVEPATFSIRAENKTASLQWFPGSVKSVLIVAKENNNCTSIPLLNENYNANAEYGKGSKVGDGFVVYKGNGTSADVSGLNPGKKYFFTIYEIDADGFYYSDISILTPAVTNSETAKQAPSASPNAVVFCTCPPVAGVTCTITGTTNTGTSVASAGGCPHVGYCDGPGTNNPWTSLASTGVVEYMFSAPVKAATLRANSVNTNDYATVSANGGTGGSLSISGVVCMGVSGLVIGPLSVAGYGGVSWTVNSTGSYTRVVCTNTGAQSGWVAACPTAITLGVLPIELVSFKGECEKNKVGLTWKTLSETNNSYFTIERSYTAENWEVIGQIPGAGNSSSPLSYSYTDDQPLNATAYYRLKQTDLNREFKYSEMISIKNCNTQKGEIDVTIYPNPASSEVVIKTDAQDATLEVYNILGVVSATKKLAAGENKLDVSSLTKGTYFFKVSNPGSVLKFTKIIVNN